MREIDVEPEVVERENGSRGTDRLDRRYRAHRNRRHIDLGAEPPVGASGVSRHDGIGHPRHEGKARDEDSASPSPVELACYRSQAVDPPARSSAGKTASSDPAGASIRRQCEPYLSDENAETANRCFLSEGGTAVGVQVDVPGVVRL